MKEEAYFIANCYTVDDTKPDGDMVWEVGRTLDLSRICLCYSKDDAEQIVEGLMLIQKQLKSIKKGKK